VCLGLSEPKHSHVFEALYENMKVDVMVLDIRLPTLKTEEKHEVVSVQQQLARMLKKAQAKGTEFTVGDLGFTLFGEHRPRILQIPMALLHFLQMQFSNFAARALRTCVYGLHEFEIEDAFYRAVVVHMRLQQVVCRAPTLAGNPPTLLGAAQEQFQNDMATCAALMKGMKTKTKRALSGVARGIMRSSVCTHEHEKHAVRHLQDKAAEVFGMVLGPKQANGSRYTPIVSDTDTIMRIMREVHAPCLSGLDCMPARQDPVRHPAAKQRMLEKLPLRMQIEVHPDEVRFHHEPRPRPGAGPGLFADTFYDEWDKGATEHDVLYQPTADEVAARFYQDPAGYDHFRGLPGEHVLVVPSSELEQRPAVPLMLAPIPPEYADDFIAGAAPHHGNGGSPAAQVCSCPMPLTIGLCRRRRP